MRVDTALPPDTVLLYVHPALVEHPDGRLEILDWSKRDLHGKPVGRDDDALPQPGVRQPELAVLSEVMAGR